MIKMKRFAIILIVFLLGRTAMAAQISIVIHEAARVHGPKLLLGDVAEFNGITEAQKKQLSAVALGDAPAFGESRKFTNISIAEALRAGMRQIGMNGDSSDQKVLKLQIPSTVTITGRGVIISETELREKIISGVSETCTGCIVKITELRTPKLEDISPSGRWDLRADYSKIRGSFQLALEVFEPNENKKIYWLSGRVVISKQVPVVLRNLAPGTRVQPGDIHMAERDITYLLDNSPGEKEAIGSLLKSPVSANQVLLKSHIKRQPALNRGQIVTLTSGKSEWSISMKGVAQDEGYVGDLVKVQNPDTKKIIAGIVVSEGVVEVR
jgi:flagella basal body P-ring formation protein FlgA